MAEQLDEDKDSKVSAHRWTALPYSFWDHWLDEDRQNHLYRVAVDSGEIEPLTEPLGQQLSRTGAGAGSYDVHPDETHFAFVANSLDDEIKTDMDVFLAEFGADEATNLTPDNEAADGSPLFSPDGQTLAFLQQSIPGFYADTSNIILHTLESGQQRTLLANWDRPPPGLVSSPVSSCFNRRVEDEGSVSVFHIYGMERLPRALTTDASYGSLSMADDCTLVGINRCFLYPPR